jgi:hypothetical protein
MGDTCSSSDDGKPRIQHARLRSTASRVRPAGTAGGAPHRTGHVHRRRAVLVGCVSLRRARARWRKGEWQASRRSCARLRRIVVASAEPTCLGTTAAQEPCGLCLDRLSQSEKPTRNSTTLPCGRRVPGAGSCLSTMPFLASFTTRVTLDLRPGSPGRGRSPFRCSEYQR